MLRQLELIKAPSITLGCHIAGSRHWILLVKEGHLSGGRQQSAGWLASLTSSVALCLLKVWI